MGIKNLNKRVILRVLSVILGSLGIVVLFGQGCGESFDSASSVSSASNQCTVDSSKIIDKNFEVIPGAQTVSISYGQQLLDSFVSCTGIQTPSQRTVDEWTSRNQSLSEYGNLTDVSGAMMMAVAAVAAETCRDLLDKEIPLTAANRGIFGAVNLSGGGLSASEISSATQLLALSCWQRPASAAEEADIVTTIGGLNTTSENGALSLCTAMLSSLAAIQQ